jgi:cysteinyl-tRNA synthetase
MCRKLLQNVSDISYSHLQEVVNYICGQVTFAVLFVGNKRTYVYVYVLNEICTYIISVLI